MVGKFNLENFEALLNNERIIHQYCYPYMPLQNTMVERKHEDLLNIVKFFKYSYIFRLNIGVSVYLIN